MNIQRASHLGMCFGVRDAIELARREAATGPTTILGDLVHNDAVLADLRKIGVRIETQLEAVRTPRVLVTAHGTSDRTRREILDRGLGLLEATCPLVHFAHQRVLELARAGFHPVIIGQRNHVEMRGLTGDLDAFDVVLEESDVAALMPRPRFGVAAQTTQPIARVKHLLGLLQSRFPGSEIRFADTVCMPTRQRQKAAEDLATSSDVVIVIGGARSNNTRELVHTCQHFCSRVHHIQSADELRPEWFSVYDTVGITAGTSTPDSMIHEVESWLRAHAQEPAQTHVRTAVDHRELVAAP